MAARQDLQLGLSTDYSQHFVAEGAGFTIVSPPQVRSSTLRMELAKTAGDLTVPALAAVALWSLSAALGAGLYPDSTIADQPLGAFAIEEADPAVVSTSMILRRNGWVFALNLAGLTSFGISTLGSVVTNGLHAGFMLAYASHGSIGLWRLATVTMPHSFELVALWLSAAIGFLGPRYALSLIRTGDLPAAPKPVSLALISLLLAALLVLAAFLEANISVPNATRAST